MNPELPNKRAGWHCPNDLCGKRYKRSQPCSQVFFTVDIKRVQAMLMQNVEFDVHRLPITMYGIDKLDNAAENKINVLKATRLLRKFMKPDGATYQITFRSILSYLAKFNEETDRRLRAAFPENVWVRRTISFDHLRRNGMYPYCEHSELSLANFGAHITR